MRSGCEMAHHGTPWHTCGRPNADHLLATALARMTHRGRQSADDVVATALACGATAEVAAQRANVSRRTVNRRLANPEFRKRIQELRSDMVERTTAMLTAAGMESAKNLLELQKRDAPFAVRLGASRSVIELGAKLRETTELEKRLQSLEEQLILNANNR